MLSFTGKSVRCVGWQPTINGKKIPGVFEDKATAIEAACHILESVSGVFTLDAVFIDETFDRSVLEKYFDFET